MTQDVTVLGAGIVGICTALSLLERGARVRLIDRSEPGQATSFGNAGVISPYSITPHSGPGILSDLPKLMFGRHRALSVRAASWPAMISWGAAFLRNGTEARFRDASDAMTLLCGPCIELYARHLQGTGAEHLLRESCYVHAFRKEAQANLDALGYAVRREHGANMERVGREGLRSLEPALSSEFKAAIVIRGQARALSPGKIGQVLAEKVRRLGGEVLQREVTGLRPEGETWRVACGGESFVASKVVLAMGAWSASLLRPLGLKPPLMAERGYHVECPSPGVDVNNSVMDADAKVVASSMEDGLRVAGQAEFGPVDAPPDPLKKMQLRRVAKEMFPDLQTTGVRFWMGRRPSFPDSLPAIGDVPGFEGLIWNFGHAHHGLMMAPKSGELAADLAMGTKLNEPLNAISPTRFQG